MGEGRGWENQQVTRLSTWGQGTGSGASRSIGRGGWMEARRLRCNREAEFENRLRKLSCSIKGEEQQDSKALWKRVKGERMRGKLYGVDAPGIWHSGCPISVEGAEHG